MEKTTTDTEECRDAAALDQLVAGYPCGRMHMMGWPHECPRQRGGRGAQVAFQGAAGGQCRAGRGCIMAWQALATLFSEVLKTQGYSTPPPL